MKILNSNNFNLKQSTATKIEKHHTEKELHGDVVISQANDNEDFTPIYDVWSLNHEYLFSIDSDGDVIFER